MCKTPLCDDLCPEMTSAPSNRVPRRTLGPSLTNTHAHILKHTHIHSPITNDEHTPDMIITLSSSLSTSVRRFSLRDSSMDRDRAFLFLGLFKTILLEEKMLLSVYKFYIKVYFLQSQCAAFILVAMRKSHNKRHGKMTYQLKMSNILNIIY